MAYRRSERLGEDGEPTGFVDLSWDGPTAGVDLYSGETRLRQGHVPFIQNMHLFSGVPVGVNGYSPLDTGQDATDDDFPMGAGQLVDRDGVETYVQIQNDGTVNKWDSVANDWDNLFNKEGTNFFPADEIWNNTVHKELIIFCNPDQGNWKYDGDNWMPLGAKNISDMESDQDAQWGSPTTESTIVIEGEQSYSAAVGAGGNATFTFTPTSNLDLTTSNQALNDFPYSKTNASFGFYIYITDASEFEEATSFYRVSTDGSNRVSETADEWIDKKTGTTVVFTDNTWFQIEIPISDMTETGTFDLSDVDTVEISVDSDGGAFTVYIDNTYIIYTDQMPGCKTLGVWTNVLFGGGNGDHLATYYTDGDTGIRDYLPSTLFFSFEDHPDFFNPLAARHLNATNQGGIVGVRRFFNQLFIGKEGSCHSLGGSLANRLYPNYALETIDITEEHGVDGHRSLVEADRNLYFTWRNNFYRYDGTGTQEIGDLISPDLQDHEASRLEQKSATFWPKRDEIWGTYPGEGDTENVKRWRYSLETGAFVESIDDSAALAVGILFKATESGLDTLVGIDHDGDWMRMDDENATDFDGTPITRIFRLPWTDGGQPRKLKCWTNMQALFGFFTSGTIDVQYRVADSPSQFDAAAFTTVTTLDTDSTTDLGWVDIYDVSRWLQVQFTATAVKYDLQYPFVIEFTEVGEWA